jgi:hypothetical protein
MNKKTLFTIGFITIFILTSLLVLVNAITPSKEKGNGFERKWLEQPSLVSQIKLKQELSRIVGFTQNNIFFSSKDPRRIITTNYALDKIDSIFIPVNINGQIQAAYDVVIDSPRVNFFANNFSMVFKWSLNTGESDSVRITKFNKTPLFSMATSISPKSAVLRAIDSTVSRQIFKKVLFSTGETVAKSTLLSEEDDLGFSTDGLLRYDSSSHRIIYMQYYQNRFYCLDTNLNLLYAGKTIDTTNINPIRTRNFAKEGKGGHSLMPSVPLKAINKQCTANNGIIYTYSTLPSNNEQKNKFLHNAVIDTYNIIDGSYRGSFYIPELNQEKLHNFVMSKNLLICLYKTGIATYALQ